MLEHTRDFRRIKKLAELYPAKNIGPWPMLISRDVHCFIEVENGKDLGVWAFEPCEDGYMMHAAMGPDCRGRKALHSGLKAIEWMFANTDCECVVAATPVDLKHTHVLPRVAGFQFREIKDGMRHYMLFKDEIERAA